MTGMQVSMPCPQSGQFFYDGDQLVQGGWHDFHHIRKKYDVPSM